MIAETAPAAGRTGRVSVAVLITAVRGPGGAARDSPGRRAGHRFLLPASVLGGAIALLVADLPARTLAVPAELPLGVVTALAGGPFFLWLVHRTRKSWGGLE